MSALILAAVVAAAGVWMVVHSLRSCRHLPAAPDNKPGTNADDLRECRRINDMPLASRKENPKP